MISVRSKLTQTSSLVELRLLSLVSMYINAVPIGGMLSGPDSPVGLFDFVDFTKSCGLPPLFLSLHLIAHLYNKSWPVFGDMISVISIIRVFIKNLQITGCFTDSSL